MNRNESTIDRLIRARLALIDLEPFFAVLATRIEIVITDRVPTMAVDGRRLFANPGFVAGLSDPELIGVFAHEVMHCAYGHFARRDGRPIDRWNVAADHAINPGLRAAGYVLPRGALSDRRFVNLSAERIYSELYGRDPGNQPQPQPQGGQGDGQDGNQPQPDGQPQPGNQSGDQPGQAGAQGAQDGAQGGGQAGQPSNQPGSETGVSGQPSGQGGQSAGQPGGAGGQPQPGQPQGGGQAGQPQGGQPDPFADAADPGGCGGILDPVEEIDPAGESELATDWEIATRQAVAVACKRAGSVPGFIARLGDDLNRAPAVDWRAALLRFIDDAARRDYSWLRPNRRHIAAGLYLPGLRSDALSHVVVAIDTSGSIADSPLAAFQAELSGLVESGMVDRVTILCCDTAIRSVAEFGRGDPVEVKPVGGGGTKFRPVFDWVEENAADAAAVVYFTDLECFDRPTDPGVPTLWAAWGRGSDIDRLSTSLGFGEVVHITD